MTIGIGELARRSGASVQVLRAWETRLGFPVPARTESGRRAYDDADVDRVQRVLALKESGVRLAEAVARVRVEGEAGPLSIYGAVRRRHPEVGPRVLRRDVLVAISHAIEDEAMSRGSSALVFGAFQRERFFRDAAPRWDEIARTSTACAVFADFAPGSGAAPPGEGSPIEIPLAPDAPLLREWAVVVMAPALSVVLTAWEIPSRGALGPHREYESLLSFDPAAVRTAAEVCRSAARAAPLPDSVIARLDLPLASDRTPSEGVDALILRILEYVQRRALG